MTTIDKNWTPDAHFYDFGRPFPYRYLVELFRESYLIKELEKIEKVNVYEPGAGTGRMLIPLASEFSDWSFIGADISESMLDVFSQRIVCESLKNITLKKADALEFLPVIKSDLLIISSLLHSTAEWKKLLSTLVSNVSDTGVICLIGEEAEIYNLALDRLSTVFPKTEIDENLSLFWQYYLQARQEVNAPSTEYSQIGCQWEINNEMPVSELKSLGFEVVCTSEIRWSHWLRVKDLLRIVEERCYSSMFTIENNLYDNLLSILRDKCLHLDMNTYIESKHVALAKFLKSKNTSD
jgi:hypothetical protein